MKKHSHRRAPKKIKKAKKSKNKLFTTISTVFVAILILASSISYFLLDNNEIILDTKKENIVEIKQIKNKPITFEEKTKALEIEYINNVDNNVYIEKPKNIKESEAKFHYEEPDYGKVDDIKIITKEKINTIIVPEKKEKIIVKPIIDKSVEKKQKKIYKPLLAIIIDDVTNLSQIRKIKNIGYTINMSFLPPTKGHKNSAKITNKLDNYMIHLPLQASSSRYEEESTLHITDDTETIDRRIASLQKLYPKAKFINNHTGSKFTSNQQAMDKLFRVLKKYNYIFLDSRTTAASVASISAKKYGLRMLSRNIFLDNNKNKKYIQNQLKKAIKIAKKNGSAVAIGHPYDITFATLKKSKYLLKGIDLVYINRL